MQPRRIALLQTSCDAAITGPIIMATKLAMSMSDEACERVDVTMLGREQMSSWHDICDIRRCLCLSSGCTVGRWGFFRGPVGFLTGHGAESPAEALAARDGLPPEQTRQERLRARAVASLCGWHVTQNVFDVPAATDPGRLSTLLALHSLAHGRPTLLLQYTGVPKADRFGWQSGPSLALTGCQW